MIMGGVCSCFGGPDNEEEEHAGSLESTSQHGISLHCFQFLSAYNVLFQRGHVCPVSSANHGRATVVPSSSDDSSISHTYHPPPRPLPYDDPRCSDLQPQSPTTELMLGKVASHCHEASELRRSNDVDGATEDLKISDYDKFSKKGRSESSVKQPQKQTSCAFNYIFHLAEDEDVCPTCLEEYTAENPKITLLCSHHFHLSCIYEWMERSENCPFCGKVMIFNESQ